MYIDVDKLRGVLFDYSKGKGKCIVSREQLEEFIIQAAEEEE